MRFTAPAEHGLGVQVVGVGAATLDDLWLVENFTASEGVERALDHVQMGGGPVATALSVLSQLGKPAALIDVCGDDSAGVAILASLARAGVQTMAMEVIPGVKSAIAVIRVRAEDGARQIMYRPCSGAEPTLTEKHQQMIQGAQLLHINGRHESLARACVEVAQPAGTLISYDGGAGRYRESIRDLVLASHLRLLSREFARQFTGFTQIPDMMASLQTGVAKVVVITDGMHGSYVQCHGSGLLHQPAYPAAKTVDTTGCGDVFHGAFLHGYLSGWDAQCCADFASRYASKNASGLGGRYALG